MIPSSPAPGRRDPADIFSNMGRASDPASPAQAAMPRAHTEVVNPQNGGTLVTDDPNVIVEAIVRPDHNYGGIPSGHAVRLPFREYEANQAALCSKAEYALITARQASPGHQALQRTGGDAGSGSRAGKIFRKVQRTGGRMYRGEAATRAPARTASAAQPTQRRPANAVPATAIETVVQAGIRPSCQGTGGPASAPIGSTTLRPPAVTHHATSISAPVRPISWTKAGKKSTARGTATAEASGNGGVIRPISAPLLLAVRM
jgi:hypothetical protein